MSDDLLTMGLREGVALITIRREKSRNALTREMCRRLAELIRQAAAQPDAQTIVLTGTGVAFSAGADLKELLAARDATDLSGFIEDAQQITRTMHACARPIVAAINGFAVGMGLELSLCADYRIASRNAIFALPERQHNLEVTNAASWLLPQAIGAAAAEELISSGRKFDAAEAYALGLVEETVAPEDLLRSAEERAHSLQTRGRLRSLSQTELETILQNESARVSSAAARLFGPRRRALPPATWWRS
jgi:enoyl-CoA hydratase